MLSHLELRLIGEVMLRNFNASGAQPTTQKFAGDKWEHHLQCNILSYAEFVSVFLQLRGAYPATVRPGSDGPGSRLSCSSVLCQVHA